MKELPGRDWEWTIPVNCMSQVYAMKRVIPIMRQQEHPAISSMWRQQQASFPDPQGSAISLGIKMCPKSSMRLTTPVAFIYLSSSLDFTNFDAGICKVRGLIRSNVLLRHIILISLLSVNIMEADA